MSTRTHILHNTNMSTTIRSHKTILFNQPMSSKFNFKHTTTFTRSSISRIEEDNIIIKLHTTHSLPSPSFSTNISNTSTTLTFCKKSKRKSIIIHTKSIGESLINFLRLSKHKMSNGFFIGITTVIIITTRNFSKFVHRFLI